MIGYFVLYGKSNQQIVIKFVKIYKHDALCLKVVYQCAVRFYTKQKDFEDDKRSGMLFKQIFALNFIFYMTNNGEKI
jgi:hypothetical protein